MRHLLRPLFDALLAILWRNLHWQGVHQGEGVTPQASGPRLSPIPAVLWRPFLRSLLVHEHALVTLSHTDAKMRMRPPRTNEHVQHHHLHKNMHTYDVRTSPFARHHSPQPCLLITNVFRAQQVSFQVAFFVLLFSEGGLEMIVAVVDTMVPDALEPCLALRGVHCHTLVHQALTRAKAMFARSAHASGAVASAAAEQAQQGWLRWGWSMVMVVFIGYFVVSCMEQFARMRQKRLDEEALRRKYGADAEGERAE